MAKIIIAEDENDIRDLIKFTLQFNGHEVHAYANGEDAYHAIMANMPDLVVLDVRMPRMTGYEVCRKIKSNPSLNHLPVVFLSAKGQEAEVKEGLEAGAEAYILKPFSPDGLVAEISKILGN